MGSYLAFESAMMKVWMYRRLFFLTWRIDINTWFQQQIESSDAFLLLFSASEGTLLGKKLGMDDGATLGLIDGTSLGYVDGDELGAWYSCWIE